MTRRIKSLKNSSDSIGNRTCDLPICSAVQEKEYILYYMYYKGTKTCHSERPIKILNYNFGVVFTHLCNHFITNYILFMRYVNVVPKSDRNILVNNNILIFKHFYKFFLLVFEEI